MNTRDSYLARGQECSKSVSSKLVPVSALECAFHDIKIYTHCFLRFLLSQWPRGQASLGLVSGGIFSLPWLAGIPGNVLLLFSVRMSSSRDHTPLGGLGPFSFLYVAFLKSRLFFSHVLILHFDSKANLISYWEHITLDHEETILTLRSKTHSGIILRVPVRYFVSTQGCCFSGWITAAEITNPFGGKPQDFSLPAHPSRPSLSQVSSS